MKPMIGRSTVNGSFWIVQVTDTGYTIWPVKNPEQACGCDVLPKWLEVEGV